LFCKFCPKKIFFFFFFCLIYTKKNTKISNLFSFCFWVVKWRKFAKRNWYQLMRTRRDESQEEQRGRSEWPGSLAGAGSRCGTRGKGALCRCRQAFDLERGREKRGEEVWLEFLSVSVFHASQSLSLIAAKMLHFLLVFCN
jgi:hypothetical protein